MIFSLVRRQAARLRDPIWWSSATQGLKTALAAVVAWLVAQQVLHLPESFLAPWSALLVVHATVYRTFSRGVRQVGAAVTGVLLAWILGSALGTDAVAIGVALVIGLSLGAVAWFGDESTTVAATALIVLTTSSVGQSDTLAYRLVDTAIGVVIGLLVNAVVWPPLARRSAVEKIDRIDDDIAELLGVIAGGTGAPSGSLDEAEQWVDRTRDIDEDLDQAWALVRQMRESAWMNPRRSAKEARDPQVLQGLLRRLEQAVADTRSMVRTLAAERGRAETWAEPFGRTWVELLARSAVAIGAADPDGIRVVRSELDSLAGRVGEQDLAPSRWPVYGALIINLRNIIDAMDEVALANPLVGQPLPMRLDHLARHRRPGS